MPPPYFCNIGVKYCHNRQQCVHLPSSRQLLFTTRFAIFLLESREKKKKLKRKLSFIRRAACRFALEVILEKGIHKNCVVLNHAHFIPGARCRMHAAFIEQWMQLSNQIWSLSLADSNFQAPVNGKLLSSDSMDKNDASWLGARHMSLGMSDFFSAICPIYMAVRVCSSCCQRSLYCILRLLKLFEYRVQIALCYCSNAS